MHKLVDAVCCNAIVSRLHCELQCVAVRCGVMHCDAVRCSDSPFKQQTNQTLLHQKVDVLRYCVLRCFVVCWNALRCITVPCRTLQRVVLRCIDWSVKPKKKPHTLDVHQRIDAACCSVLQCVAVCCSVLQCDSANPYFCATHCTTRITLAPYQYLWSCNSMLVVQWCNVILVRVPGLSIRDCGHPQQSCPKVSQAERNKCNLEANL